MSDANFINRCLTLTGENMLGKLKFGLRKIKAELSAIFVAAKDPRTPSMAKLVAIVTAAYALSPIDLIPDFIPVLGYVDDLLILPIGIALTIRLIPLELMAQFREDAEKLSRQPANWFAAIIVILLWLAMALIAYHYWRH